MRWKYQIQTAQGVWKFKEVLFACIPCPEYKILSHPLFVGIKIVICVSKDQIYILYLDIINSNSEQLRNDPTQKTEQNWQGGSFYISNVCWVFRKKKDKNWTAIAIFFLNLTSYLRSSSINNKIKFEWNI